MIISWNSRYSVNWGELVYHISQQNHLPTYLAPYHNIACCCCVRCCVIILQKIMHSNWPQGWQTSLLLLAAIPSALLVCACAPLLKTVLANKLGLQFFFGHLPAKLWKTKFVSFPFFRPVSQSHRSLSCCCCWLSLHASFAQLSSHNNKRHYRAVIEWLVCNE